MKNTLPAIAVLLFLSASGCRRDPVSSTPSSGVEKAPAVFTSPLPGGGTAWELAWSDEFDYPDAGLTNRWVSQNGPSGHILCSRWRENAVVSNGTLRLVARKEKRGGQEWTAGSIWTKQSFQYGYFECRYKYGAAEGLNNSFWLMPTAKPPAGHKRFEIDINEGHYPNKVNTNIHNHSDRTNVNGRATHPTSHRSFVFGVRPDVTLQLENPVSARKVRLASRHPGAVHIGEFRIYGVNAAGYPDATSATADRDRPGLVNFARDPAVRISASGFVEAGKDTSKSAADGRGDTRWVSQREGGKWIEFDLSTNRLVGCIQFLNGYGGSNDWKSLLSEYRIEYHDGRAWNPLSDFDVRDGAFNFAREFHVFGLEWTETDLAFYLDGREIRRAKNEFCHGPAPVWLSLAVIAWAGPVTDAIDGAAMEVDYVRVYRRKP